MSAKISPMSGGLIRWIAMFLYHGNASTAHLGTYSDIFNEQAHIVVINCGMWGCPFGEDREHFEIGFRTMTSPVDYFLFIEVDSEKMPPILERYRLEPIT